MSFYIYDMGGDRIRYEMGMDWRGIKPVEEVRPKQTKEREEEKRKDTVEEAFKGAVAKKPIYAPAAPILASQIMKRPVVSLSQDATLKEAWELISRRRFRHVPIINKEGKLVGIISDRTLLNETSQFNPNAAQGDRVKIVKDIMVTKVLTARPETDIGYIAKVFIEEKVGGMPIVDHQGLVVGMLTRSDILRTLVKVIPFELQI